MIVLGCHCSAPVEGREQRHKQRVDTHSVFHDFEASSPLLDKDDRPALTCVQKTGSVDKEVRQGIAVQLFQTFTDMVTASEVTRWLELK